MRTTVRLPDGLMRQAKKTAAERGTTLTALVEEGLREVISRRKQPRTVATVHLTTFGGGGKGLLPGVDLDNSAALLDLMEGDESPRR